MKTLHWTLLPLFIWFVVVQPSDVARIGPQAVRLHSVFGLIFVTLALIWSADYLFRGLAGRPGPKLKGRLRPFHQILHKVLIWGLFLVALTGFLLGVTASRQLFAGDLVPIGVPLGLPRANDFVGLVHTVEFYGLAVVAAVHALFHIWRHIWLRDNALRIMVPKMFHRFL
ncbi:MAG: cytochrome b/b6 domain-containing protein [Ahrensia sp.]|nr:cytochrome b/b6 domain-containing protein [Ahrensia sp.]